MSAALWVAGFGGIFSATISVAGTSVMTAILVAILVCTLRYNRGVLTA